MQTVPGTQGSLCRSDAVPADRVLDGLVGTFDSYGSFHRRAAVPAVPGLGEPLAGGVYPAAYPVEWSADQPDTLDVAVYRAD